MGTAGDDGVGQVDEQFDNRRSPISHGNVVVVLFVIRVVFTEGLPHLYVGNGSFYTLGLGDCCLQGRVGSPMQEAVGSRAYHQSGKPLCCSLPASLRCLPE